MKEQTGGGYSIYLLINIFSYCAVDGFAIISGYMANNRPRKWSRLVEMWFQAFFYSFVITLILVFAGIGSSLGIMDIIRCALPVTSEYFWYFTAFFGLYFVIPVLDRFLFAIEVDVARKAFIIIVMLFSVMGTVGDPFQSNRGYSLIWLAALYCIGVLAKRIQLFESRKSGFLIMIWVVCVVVTWGASICGIDQLTNYVSSTIMFSGLIMVILFSRLQISNKLSTIITHLSPLAFGIYLFQLNRIIWEKLIKDTFISVAGKPLFVGIPMTFMFAFVIFISGLVVEFLRTKAADFIKIPNLSRKIVGLVDYIMKKCFIFLK